MTKQYDDTNRGSIWKNERKRSDRDPDFTGTGNIDGDEYWISGWLRAPDAKPTAPALKISFKKKDGTESKPAKAAAGITDDFVDSEIPF